SRGLSGVSRFCLSFHDRQTFKILSGLSIPIATNLPPDVPYTYMVEQTERDEMTWYRCEECGLMFDDREDAEQHESNCDAEEPSYLQ
ncbi:MAG: hypothetical protein ABEI86_13635, partial [Halobacteriaceae archaeon]